MTLSKPTSATTRRTLLAATAALLCSTVTLPALAQQGTYPTKPLKLVVGYAAGGATDVIARLVGQKLGEGLGQTVVIDNRAGANSNLGAEAVARSPADGYTVFVFTIANTINATLYDKLSYDPQKDFEPVGLIAKVPNILVVNNNVPVKTLAEYVAYAKAQPQGVTFASSGSGSSIHLSGEMFKMVAKLNLLHVPYRGSAPAIADVVAGQVPVSIADVPLARAHVRAGTLRPIALAAAQRSAALPDMPTFAELGVPNLDFSVWVGFLAPAGTPKAIIDKLNREIVAIVREPAMTARLLEIGFEVVASTPEEFGQTLKTDQERYGVVVRKAGVKLD